MSTKTTRRLLALALCALMAAASCLSALALSGTIVIKECDDLELTLPENMTGVTRSSDPGDMYYAMHHLSYDEVQESFEASDSYLQAMDNDNVLTLTLSYLNTGAKDFGSMSAEELSEVSRNFLGGTDSDVQYVSSTIDEPGHQMAWMFLNMTISDEEGKATNQFQATTVIYGMNITLTLYRNGGDVEASDYAVLESIVRTVKPPHVFPFRRYLPYILGVLALAVLVLLIIVIIKNIKHKRENPVVQSKNDKILEELAEVYQQKRTNVPAAAPAETPAAPADEEAPKKSSYVDIFANSDERKTGDRVAVERVPLERRAAEHKEEAHGTADAGDAEQQVERKPLERPQAQPAPAKKRPTVEELLSDDYDDSDDDMPRRKYSDEDIERLLSD